MRDRVNGGPYLIGDAFGLCLIWSWRWKWMCYVVRLSVGTRGREAWMLKLIRVIFV